jgi:hypothetical protein
MGETSGRGGRRAWVFWGFCAVAGCGAPAESASAPLPPAAPLVALAVPATDWPLLQACGLPSDYVPPWGTDAVPEAELVKGAIGGGATPVIGCPPAPAAPGEPDVEAYDFRFEGTPYKEPNRRIVLNQLAAVRDCYQGQSPESVADVELVIAIAGHVSEARVVVTPHVVGLHSCIDAVARSLTFHSEPDGSPARVAYRYRRVTQ